MIRKSCLINEVDTQITCWEYDYYRIGKEEQGKECMKYVIGHGNTLKCKEEAEKYVTV